MASNSTASLKIPNLCIAIYLVESLLICLGNALSILVFWRRRRSLRRTSYLLINLAVADLSLGLFMVCSTVITQVWSWSKATWYTRYTRYSAIVVSVLIFESIFSLTLISLETAYAMVFPFRHRTTGRRAYCFAVTLVWLLAVILSAVVALSHFYFNQYDFLVTCTVLVITAMCLTLMSSSYLLIWCSVSKQSTRAMRERNQRKKLSVTLLIVTVLSLMTWIPGQFSIFMKMLQVTPHESFILYGVLLSNSFLNPLVYTFRMPEFRREIKLIICELQCCKLKLRAAAPSSPACHVISMSIIHAHELQVLRSPYAQQANDGNANKLQFQGENLNPGFINEDGRSTGKNLHNN